MWSEGLSASASRHLLEWTNPEGWWDRGRAGTALRAAQDELIEHGFMAVDGSIVRLTTAGSAARRNRPVSNAA